MGSPDRQRWGILGGAFDPVHLGHLQLARDCRTARQLERVLFVPSFTPPHKPEGCEASFDDRCAMVERAIGDDPELELSTIEREIEGPGYTLHLVREFKKRYPSIDFFFIIGADNISQLRSWHKPEAIFREVRVLAGTRPGYDLSVAGLPPDFSLDLVASSAVDISATELREMLHGDADRSRVKAMLPSGVLAYIKERNLYSHG